MIPSMSEPPFRGMAVALVSLFDDDGRLLVEETAEHAARVAAEGLSGVLLAGTTGEPDRLDGDDRRRLTQATRAALPRGVALVVGTGNADQAEAVRLTEAVAGAGADAVIAIAPRGIQDPSAYYAAVASAADVPVLAYHFPRVAPPGIPVELLASLPVCGVKDSSGDAERLLAELDGYGGAVYVGSPLLLALAGRLGAAGAIVALANVEPRRCLEAWEGDLGAQAELAQDHRAAQRDFPAGLARRVAQQPRV
jgi:dihydrodipicolinate synthase/N-acetylneuraminate lyase